ncbi:MAG TPA: M20/M25/M40 family metallo-hydrolase [Leptospiraceae bacterium]|nr:M20/M25/M40 family metallo-hydrolase [Leptospiraceae bacterium]HMW05689.1 M20/M25/M40 family metallo-hydrolase [Leptospiraceae bacterium]HMX33517.1 M20/M25/M40 family metallo-hydrolase [Leptospiraceae bacterium]HMY30278.1 M20/M25/M40 family metallo-hydrolase [Leptospiraceae bacterium]HMZ66389.1 M20/M25/M40 family metallo-hydrolase [Leptospiraceae bacterium]
MKKLLLSFLVLIFLVLSYTILFSEKGISIKKQADNDNLPNFDQIAEEAALDLQKYIQIKTIRGNELESALFLKIILEKYNIPSKIITPPNEPSRANLFAELPGTEEEGGVIFMNHMDVVEAEAVEWKYPPFNGIRIKDRIYGRGAVDMKGLGIMQLYAMLLIKKSGIKLKHKLMFAALADEESRSAKGAQFIVKEHKELFKGYEYIHNEGGTGTDSVAVPGSKIFNLQYAEKGILWLELEAKAESGHGSTPPIAYAAKNMVNFLTELQEFSKETIISDITAAFFYQMGEASPFPNSFVLKRSRNPIIQLALNKVINSNRHLRAMTSNTVSITGIDSDPIGINVITNHTKGSVDIRLLPGVDPNDYLNKIRKIAEKYKIAISVKHSEAASVSPMDSKFFQILAGTAVKVIPNAIVTPFLSPGTTDSSYFRLNGFKCYGLIPALLTDVELDGIHGKDESMRVGHLKTGIQILYETIINYNKL